MKFPQLFPQPKHIQANSEQALALSKNIPWVLCFADNDPLLARAAHIFAEMLEADTGEKVLLNPEATSGLRLELLCNLNGNHGEEEYTLEIQPERILLNGNSWKGTLYAGMTALQLMSHNGKYLGTLPLVTIHDWPDIPLRAASRWLIGCEGWEPAYDWGDGREAMLQRYREKINFALRYKINTAFFEGFDWNTEKYPGYAEDMRTLNQYAAERNVILEYGGFAVSFSHFSDPLSSSEGLGAKLNREFYPNGPIYHCLGRKPHQFKFTRTYGTCRSNEELYRFKQEQLADYVRKIEPRMLYIHNEDSGYEEIEEYWPLRCKHCREKWPSDQIGDSQGAAGAIIYGYRKLYEAVCSVKNDHYDGAKDCHVILISPVYGSAIDDDEMTEKNIRFWETVSALLPEAPNLYMGVREQLLNFKDNSPRITPVVKAIKQKQHKVFLFSLNGSDNFLTDGSFSAAAQFNYLFKGVDCLFNFSGSIFQEPQEVYNSECCWNLPPCKITDAAEIKRLYAQYTCYLLPKTPCDPPNLPAPYGIPQEFLQPQGFLTRFCHSFYGTEAGDRMLQFLQIGRVASYAAGFSPESAFPVTQLYSRFRRKSHFCHRFDFRTLTDKPKRLENWKELLQMTTEGRQLVAQAVPHAKGYAGLSSLQGLLKFLIIGEAFAELCVLTYSESPNWTELSRKIDETEALINQLFPFQEPNPHDGEVAFWPHILAHFRRVVVENEE